MEGNDSLDPYYNPNNDLFMAPKPKVKLQGWVIIYQSGIDAITKEGCTEVWSTYQALQNVYDNKEEAEIQSANYRRAFVAKVEWEEEA